MSFFGVAEGEKPGKDAGVGCEGVTILVPFSGTVDGGLIFAYVG